MKVSVDEKGRPTVEDTLDRQSNINGGNKNLLYCRKRLENNRKTLKSSAQKQQKPQSQMQSVLVICSNYVL